MPKIVEAYVRDIVIITREEVEAIEADRIVTLFKEKLCDLALYQTSIP